MGNAAGPVPVGQRNAQSGTEFSQTIGMVTGYQFPGQAYRTEFFSDEITADVPKLVLDDIVIEIHAMCDKNRPLRNSKDGIRNLIDSRRIADRVVINAC